MFLPLIHISSCMSHQQHFLVHIHDNPDLQHWNLTPLSPSIAADVAAKQCWMWFPASGVACLDVPCPFICVITSRRTEIRHTVRASPFTPLKKLKSIWQDVKVLFVRAFAFHRGWKCREWASVRTANFRSKHCWQLSIVIRSHVTKPSVNQLSSSDTLRVVWVWVCVCARNDEGAGFSACVCVCVCATAVAGSPRCHSQSEFMTGVWQVPQQTAWCADTDGMFS